MCSFYVFKRSNGVYYVQFVDPICRKLSTARSTRKRDYDDAVKQSYEWLLTASVCRHEETAAERFMALAVSRKFSADEIREIYGALVLYYKGELGISSVPEYWMQNVQTETGSDGVSLLGWLKGFGTTIKANMCRINCSMGTV